MGRSDHACLFGLGHWGGFFQLFYQRGRVRTFGVHLGRPGEDALSVGRDGDNDYSSVKLKERVQKIREAMLEV
jgi:hypothetical protein